MSIVDRGSIISGELQIKKKSINYFQQSGVVCFYYGYEVFTGLIETLVKYWISQELFYLGQDRLVTISLAVSDNT